EKIATQGDCPFPVSRVQAKKTRQGLDVLSHFQAHEKTVHTVIALFTFLERKKKSPLRAIAPFQFLGCKLKRPVRVSIRLLISELMKKQPVGVVFLIFVYEW
ncbi:TPA: hypothetical protein ACGO5N_000179, partial [Streptococcus suis]